MSLFCNMGLYFIPSFATILLRKRDREMLLFFLFQMCSCCHVAVNVLYLFPTVTCVGLWSLIVVFHDHSHLFFSIYTGRIKPWSSRLSHSVLIT